jgi:pyruvate/2-oxoglutarate dehydrogenase complex dihydrolipoamide acyltransferase (E2) component
MKVEVLLPQLGFGMTEGRIDAWMMKEGDKVVEGQPIYTIENDKALQEVEAPATGTLHILKLAGQTYPVGELLAEIAID